ncbi:SgcJ/EcaC family oxidoreductase [Hymenobacter arizonensis]|uniref:SnoaL-like domain-containing protein n=1 Tax=Hymenobacter arizonensis TaxID=1227077 RepID=A0A1I6AU50_HYMAR|nr:SgcJ/EcaC family oxidoreductase [Hymenobacter arizonensis]SFQ72173.1 conserved hypothetical protein [Hymenobacter arizonensis]
MKALLFSLVLALGARGAIAQQLPPADAAAIRQVLQRIDTNYKDHKFSEMATYTTPDVSWVNIVGMWWRGRPDVQLAHQRIFDSMFKGVSFKQGEVTMRAITPDVALVNMYYEVGAYYPPDGVNRGVNKMGDDQDLLTLVMVKKQGKWLLAAGHNTVVNAQAVANNPIATIKK